MHDSAEPGFPEPTVSARGARDGGPPPKRATLSSPRVMAVALTVAVLAAVLAGVWWWRSSSGPSSAFNNGDVRDAKAKVCMQSAAVSHAVVRNTHLANPVPDDRRGMLAVAANARLALLGGGVYLHNLVSDQPAAPKELTDAVTAMGDTLEQLGISYLAGQPNEAQAPLREQLDAQLKQVGELCH